jgi:hypothetical protein
MGVDDFERFGFFYLGRPFDRAAGQLSSVPLLYEGRDLTTHAMCVGMTGSGKTGLAIGLIEEAAIDRVPVIVIDPKGDLTNLLLAFPGLQPAEFLPWINPDDAQQAGLTPEAFAAQVATTWQRGLAEWGQAGARIQAYRDAAECLIFTPGSDAGLPVNILHSLQAPTVEWETQAEELRQQASSTVSAILGLIGIDSDPVRSREHILLATIFEYYWRQGQAMDLPTLIHAIQQPPIRTLGVTDVDAFFPPKDRFELAMDLNGLIAAPSFQTWLSGPALDVDQLLYGPQGQPRVSIFYIAHLDDSERMFFVSLLLEQVLAWTRQQSGTNSLRALLVMDEVYGYLPPLGSPPSKGPLLRLLKQARAYGLGIVLATQNPADLDYKGLTNMGTWFIGRLQAQRDKERLLDGLQGVAAGEGTAFDRAAIDRAISGLAPREFLLHNVHDDELQRFKTRWTLCYLRGPLTRPQIRDLMAPQRVQFAPAAGTPDPLARTADRPDLTTRPPLLPTGVTQVYLPLESGPEAARRRVQRQTGVSLAPGSGDLVYRPALLGQARVRLVDRKLAVDEVQDVTCLLPVPTAPLRWGDAQPLPPARALDPVPEPGALFLPVPPAISTARALERLADDLADHLYHTARVTRWYNATLKLYSQPSETARDFRIRCEQVARTARDDQVDQLRLKYRPRLARIQSRLQRAQDNRDQDEAEAAARGRETWASIGESLAILLFGARRMRVASVPLAKQRLAEQARLDVAEGERIVASLEQEIADLQADFQREAEAITARWVHLLDDQQEVAVTPRRSDVIIHAVAVAWLPGWELAASGASGAGSHTRVEAWT